MIKPQKSNHKKREHHLRLVNHGDIPKAIKHSLTADGSVTVKINDFLYSADENMGIGYLRYYDPTTTWVHFSNYGFKIKISTTDTNKPCCP